jgi:Undecaprenyl-phosphate galactose phosphotransferase WbaP
MAFAYKEHAVSPANRRALLGLDPIRAIDPAHARLARPGRIVMLLSLILVDALSAQIAFYLGAELYPALAGARPVAFGFSAELSAIALSLPIGYLLLDVYRVHGQAPIERFPLRIKATCLVFALLVGWTYATRQTIWPFGAAALTFMFALVLPLLGETIVRNILIRWGLWGVPAVVIGAGPIGQQVVRALQGMPELGLRPIGFFDDHSGGEDAPTSVEDIPILGSVADSAKYSSRVETAIVTMPLKADGPVDAVAAQLGYRDIIVVPDLHELPTLWVRTRDLNGLIGLHMRRNLLLRRNRLLKLTIDRVVAWPLFVVSVPIIAILSLWIMAVSKGSPFYVQLRAGKNGRPIKVWKLRTMYPDAEAQLEGYLNSNPSARLEWDRYFKLTNDPRILPGVGHFLRRSSLDELPQIFNVIRGEMSLVGPRPLPQGELDQSFDAVFQALRSSVIPGITGLWQVSARSDGDQHVQQALDTYYIRNWSIWIDFYILSRTPGAVLARRGAR